MRGQQLTLPDEIDDLVQAVYEERVDVPESLRERLDKAVMVGEGEAITKRGQANQAIMGLPDDASWNDPARFVLYDEDEPVCIEPSWRRPGSVKTQLSLFRYGRKTDSIPEAPPDFARAKQWFLRAVSLSRKGVINSLRALGVPEGWKKSPLLRNCFPLELDAQGRWIGDVTLRLDDDLGVVYESKEAE